MLSKEISDLIGKLPAHVQGQVLELVERAATAEHPEELVRELEFLLGVQVTDSNFGEWQDCQDAMKGGKP